jgi:co-chaperonin GroES (HSP10)
MIEVTEEMINTANDLVAKGCHKAVGYRLIIKTIKGSDELEAAEKSEFATLAAAGFTAKSQDQLEKEDRGRQYGIVVSIGDGAFKATALGGSSWVEEGDIVYFDRYAGVHIELPPGSKQMYRMMNDESLLTKLESK